MSGKKRVVGFGLSAPVNFQDETPCRSSAYYPRHGTPFHETPDSNNSPWTASSSSSTFMKRLKRVIRRPSMARTVHTPPTIAESSSAVASVPEAAESSAPDENQLKKLWNIVTQKAVVQGQLNATVSNLKAARKNVSRLQRALEAEQQALAVYESQAEELSSDLRSLRDAEEELIGKRPSDLALMP